MTGDEYYSWIQVPCLRFIVPSLRVFNRRSTLSPTQTDVRHPGPVPVETHRRRCVTEDGSRVPPPPTSPSSLYRSAPYVSDVLHGGSVVVCKRPSRRRGVRVEGRENFGTDFVCDSRKRPVDFPPCPALLLQRWF